jgi:hypothetical protein
MEEQPAEEALGGMPSENCCVRLGSGLLCERLSFQRSGEWSSGQASHRIVTQLAQRTFPSSFFGVTSSSARTMKLP